MKLLLLLLATTMGCLGTTDINSETTPVSLHVLAYNVEYSTRATAEEIGAALKTHNPDVVCFSEAPGGDWTERVAKEMGLEHVVVGRYSTAGHVDKYKTIVSRTPLYDYEEILMADTLHTVTKATTQIEGYEFTVYAVHFPFGWRDQAHIDETTNKIEVFVEQLRDRKAEEPYQLLMGDFNFILPTETVESPYYEMFVNEGFDIAWNELGIGVSGLTTMVDEEGQHEGGQVIDHIMYDTSKVSAVYAEIIEMERPLSDHKPVSARLTVK